MAVLLSTLRVCLESRAPQRATLALHTPLAASTIAMYTAAHNTRSGQSQLYGAANQGS